MCSTTVVQVVRLHLTHTFCISETEVTGHTTNITNLPPEVMVTIFSYLNPQELCQCSQVSTAWSQLAKTGSLWKHLYPVRWARGKLHLAPLKVHQLSEFLSL